MLLLTLPVALIVTWLFHNFVKQTIVELLPLELQVRITNSFEVFPFWGISRFLTIVLALLIGMATHLLWDSFTHPGTWIYRNWGFLQQSVRLPLLGFSHWYKILQHGSTMVGLGILTIWVVRWYRTTPPQYRTTPATDRNRSSKPALIIFLVACAGAALRPLVSIGIPNSSTALKKCIGQAIVTFVALLWWQLIVYRAVSNRRPNALANQAGHRN